MKSSNITQIFFRSEHKLETQNPFTHFRLVNTPSQTVQINKNKNKNQLTLI